MHRDPVIDPIFWAWLQVYWVKELLYVFQIMTLNSQISLILTGHSLMILFRSVVDLWSVHQNQSWVQELGTH